jgi:ubiquinone/menaquinone biosynthesis C-methylase UbiE
MGDKRAIIDAFTDLSPRYEQVVDSELKRFWGWSYEGFIDNLIDLGHIDNEDIVLDVATGTAVIPRKLLEKGKTQGKIYGLDITLAMLDKAFQKIKANGSTSLIDLTCASAMAMPYQDGTFDVIICGLATHHLDVPVVLGEMKRVLKLGGRLTIADVGGSSAWRLPGISHLIRLATFLYFLPKEGFARAQSEASALANVYTANEWKELLAEQGFSEISALELPSSHFWSPCPLVICARTV